MADWTDSLQPLLETALMALAFSAIFESARRLGSGGLSRWPALALALGLLVPVYEANASLHVPAIVRATIAEQASSQAAEPPGGWEKAALSPQERTTQSLNAALINYWTLGRRDTFIDATGQRVDFNPSQEQMRTRERLVRDQKGAEDASAQFVERGLRLFTESAVFLIAGLSMGWLAGGRARRRGVQVRRRS